jgi:hypothetical protein
MLCTVIVLRSSFVPDSKCYKMLILRRGLFHMLDFCSCHFGFLLDMNSEWHSETGSVAGRMRSEWQRKTSSWVDRVLHHLWFFRTFNSSEPLREWSVATEGDVRPRAVGREFLKPESLECRRLPKALTDRFSKGKEHTLWTVQDWRKIMFGDERQGFISGNQSSVCLRSSNVYTRSWDHEELIPVFLSHC